jgi:predicted O-linked N-acetylglucosamine transferase (SPINDLY family)
VVGHINLATVYADQGNLDEALEVYQRALALDPNNVDAHSNLALALQRLGKSEEAEQHCLQALAINPNFVEARLNLGISLASQGKVEEAARKFKETIDLKPDYAQAHCNLGIAQQMQEKMEEAIVSYRESVRLQPDYALAHGALANALQFQGEVDEAEVHLREAIKQQGVRQRPTTHLRIALATLLPVVYQSVADIETWRRRLIEEIGQLREQQVLDDLTEETVVNFFYLPYQGLNDRDIRREFARLHRVPTDHSPLTTHHSPSAKIRIGFLSSFFRAHTIGNLMLGLVANLSRESFEVVVLSIGRHDDETAAQFKQHADRYLEVPRHLPAARALIADQKLDVLFYSDIGMDPVASTLAFSRLAPVQCTTWGHPVTTGLDTIDYFISSEALETEEAKDHYTETLVKLKTLPIYYYRPTLPVEVKTRADFGLPADAHLYACPQSLFKLHPEFDEVLAGILCKDPHGLLVLSSGLAPQAERLLRQRFATSMPDVVDRVKFLPKLSRPEFLNLLAVTDVLLDPLHFGGGNTSYEGLAFGVPIVTLPSQFLKGRITFALYQQMQVLDCVPHSPEEYIDLALRLGTDAAYREAIREKIRAASGVLFENSEGIRELERFFRRAVSSKT